MGKPTSINIRGLRGEQRAEQLERLDLSRVLILAIDPARDFPKALTYNYFSTVLENPFFFAVNSEGIMTLHKKLQHWVSCVKALRVFVGIEVAGCYHDASYFPLPSQILSLEEAGLKKLIDFESVRFAPPPVCWTLR